MYYTFQTGWSLKKKGLFPKKIPAAGAQNVHFAQIGERRAELFAFDSQYRPLYYSEFFGGNLAFVFQIFEIQEEINRFRFRLY
jgi:hypothetical protein